VIVFMDGMTSYLPSTINSRLNRTGANPLVHIARRTPAAANAQATDCLVVTPCFRCDRACAAQPGWHVQVRRWHSRATLP